MGGRKVCEAGELNPAEPCTIGEQLKHEGVAWRALLTLDTELARNENEECVRVITDFSNVTRTPMTTREMRL